MQGLPGFSRSSGDLFALCSLGPFLQTSPNHLLHGVPLLEHPPADAAGAVHCRLRLPLAAPSQTNRLRRMGVVSGHADPFAFGQFSHSRAARLTAEGIPSPDAGRLRKDRGIKHPVSGVWHQTTVVNIARNPLLVAVATYGLRSMGDKLRFTPSGPPEP